VLRRRYAAAVLLPVLLASGCSSSAGNDSATSPPSSSALQSNASAAPGSAAATALAAKIRAGLSGLTSAHIAVDAGSLGGTSVGDISYAGGVAKASDIVADSGSGKSRIVTIGSTSYAMLPKGRNTTGKPWVTVTASSKNEFVRALASSLSLNKAAASLPAVADLVNTATSVQPKTATRYALMIDPSKSKGTTLGTLLADIGQKTVPVTIDLDDKARPVKIQIAVKLGSQSFKYTVDVSKFNAPVHISAPPADEIATS
jgi:hypothetical protein